VLEKSELLFKKEPQFSKGLLGMGKIYENSIVTENKIEDLIKEKKVADYKSKLTTGHCIVCGQEIKLDPKRPYCYSHYKDWAKSQDHRRKETYCHTCGENHQSSIQFPSCRSCYRDLRYELEYPTF
jgi:ribosomal protein S14